MKKGSHAFIIKHESLFYAVKGGGLVVLEVPG